MCSNFKRKIWAYRESKAEGKKKTSDMYFIAFIHLIVSSKNTGNRLPLHIPGYLPDPRIELISPSSPALAGRFFTTEPPEKLHILLSCFLM